MGYLEAILSCDEGVGPNWYGSTGVEIATAGSGPIGSPFEGEGLSSGCIVRANEPMQFLTTFRVGGPADWYVEPATEKDVAIVVKCCRRLGLPLLVVGHGSNLLVRDGGIRGVVMSLRRPAFRRVVAQGNKVICGAGAPLHLVARVACESGVSGFEFMDGIPGTVGGALRTNAGAFGASTCERVKLVRHMDLEGFVTETGTGGLRATYRECALFGANIALAAMFEGGQENPERIRAKMEDLRRRRRETQPSGWSAGCVFKNTAVGAAGWLIDQAGLKGLRVGGAVVSALHANFIVNDGTASGADVIELIEKVRAKVRERWGIELETEVQIVGEDG